MNLSNRTNHFVNSATAKFNAKYDYSAIIYKNANINIAITCPIHGVFWQTPWAHLSSKHGCPQCGTAAMAQQQKQKTHKRFQAFINNPQNLYDYSLSKFDKITDKITVICKEHGSFSLTLDHHLHGVGCKKCADKNKPGGYSHKFFKNNPDAALAPGLLYLVRFFSETESFIKVGITKHTLAKRYKYSPYKYEIIKTAYSSLYNCFQTEEKIKKLFANFKYQNKEKFHLTESFNTSVTDEISTFIIFNQASTLTVLAN